MTHRFGIVGSGMIAPIHLAAMGRRAYFQGGGIPQLFQLVVSAVGNRRVGPKLPLG